VSNCQIEPSEQSYVLEIIEICDMVVELTIKSLYEKTYSFVFI